MSHKAIWSMALVLVLTLRIPLPNGESVGVAAPVAAQVAPSPGFGYAGPAQWNAYAWNTPSGAGEPTLGVSWNVAGGIDRFGAPNTGTSAIFQARVSQWKVDFDDSANPPAATVTDVSYGGLQTAIGFDPIMFTDTYTGRAWAGELEIAGGAFPAGTAQPTVGCTELWSTDDNGVNWNPGYACMPYWFDHETIGAGPWPAGGPYLGPAGGVQLPPGTVPPQSPVQVYPSATYYCAQAAFSVLITECEISYDGGTTYVETSPPWQGGCGGLHGHIRVAPDGTAMLPNRNCSGAASFAATTDNGQTWAIRSPPGAGSGAFDPSVAPSFRTPSTRGAAPATGDHYTYFGMAQDNGAWIGVTPDDGLTWTNIGSGNGAPANTKWLEVGQYANPPVLRAEFAEVIAGDWNRAAFAFLGSTSAAPTTGSCTGAASVHVWYQYVAMTYDAGVTWDVERVSNDPVQRGRIWDGGGGEVCRNMLDFQDIVVDAYGRVLIAQADGCVGSCIAAPVGTAYCASGAPATSCQAVATIVRQTTGLGLFTQFDLGGTPPVITPGLPCPPLAAPHLYFDSPAENYVATTPQPNFYGRVVRENTGVTLLADAHAPQTAPYLGLTGSPIPIVGTATCNVDPVTCTWTPIGNTIPAFSPNANSCTPDVIYYTPGTFNLRLTVYDPATGQTASDIAWIQVNQVGPPLPPIPPPYVPCMPGGVLLDNDPDNSDPPPAADDHLDPATYAQSGVNELTCFGGDFDGPTFTFQVSVTDSMLPTQASGPAPYTGAAMEYYWVKFTPNFGPYTGVQQTIQVPWTSALAPGDACFLLAAMAVNVLGVQDIRSGMVPEPACDPARTVNAAWAGNTLVISFSMLEFAPTGVAYGNRFNDAFAWAWHFTESTMWGNAGGVAFNAQTLSSVPGVGNILTTSTCITIGTGANCGAPHEDDFSPSCNNGLQTPPTAGVDIVFTSPTTFGVIDSCNPDCPCTLVDPVTTLDPPRLLGAVDDLRDSVFGQVGSFLQGIGGLFGPSSSAPPTSPAVVSSSSTPCPVAPPSPVMYEFVRLTPTWGPSVDLGVNTQPAPYADTWATLLDPFTSGDVGWQTLHGTWCEAVNPGSGPMTWVLLDEGDLHIYVDIPGQGTGGSQEAEGGIAGESTPGDDMDHDGVRDAVDNCPVDANPQQDDLDGDLAGDACDPDIDGDGFQQGADNCPFVADPVGRDSDTDGLGDACDSDDDNDGVLDANTDDPSLADNCPYVPNVGQQDADHDGIGDLCDDDLDNDGVADYADFYPEDASKTVNAANDQAQAKGTPEHLAASAGDEPTHSAAPNPLMYAAFGFLGALLAGVLLMAIIGSRRKA